MDKGKSVAVIEEEEEEEEMVGWSKGAGDIASSSRGGGDVTISSRGEGDAAASSSNNGAMMIWSRELDRHYFGTVSTAVMKPNGNLEDHSQVELGRTATFVGVYDGHGGGHQAAAHVRRNLMDHLMRRIRNTSTMSVDYLREAFLITEASWLDRVGARFESDPYIAGYGTCCLVGVLWKRNLYLANVGDSRAVMGRAFEDTNEIDAQQLTMDDNVRYSDVRAEVQALHPDEPRFVVEDESLRGVFLIKGRIQVSKSIGDAYMKRARFNLDHVDKKFELNAPVSDDNPALSADPSTYTIPIESQDRFLILASGGLWDLMTTQDAADIVNKYPRAGIAERLITEGLTIQTAEADRRRRRIHEDISVVVIFFDHTLQGAGEIQEEFPKLSLTQGFVSPTSFTALDEADLAHILSRMVCLNNLPYNSNMLTIAHLLPSPMEMQFGPYGFTARVLFSEVYQAIQFVEAHRNNLILLGKLCCVSFVWEHSYRRTFRMVDLYHSRAEAPFTVLVSGLAMDITVGSIAWFFILNGLHLNNLPILHVRRHGSLFAFVTFRTVQDTILARLLNGTELQGRRLRVRPSDPPQFKIARRDFRQI